MLFVRPGNALAFGHHTNRKADSYLAPPVATRRNEVCIAATTNSTEKFELSEAVDCSSDIMSDESGIEKWDLTPKISPYLDRHMMFPLLEYLDELITDGRVSYNSNDVAAARLALLRPTHMVDYAIDIYRGIHGAESEVPKEMEDQKAKVYQRLGELEKGCRALHDLCSNEEERVS